MKKIKRRLALLTVVGILGATTVIFASTVKPADTDLSRLGEFHNEILKEKREILDERVKEGSITQEEADVIYERIEENHALRNGTGNTGLGRGAMWHGRGRGMMGLGRGFGCGGW